MMRLLAWVLAHSLGLLGLILATEHLPADDKAVALVGLPLVPGAIQWLFLRSELGWWGLAWLPACCLGFFLSFAGCWWFLLLVGAGLGVAQCPLLLIRGFHRWWLWPIASGIGWFGGMVVGSGLANVIIPAAGNGAGHIALVYAATGAIYGLATGLALRAMPRKTAAQESRVLTQS